jgi:hypothetical protein
MNKAGKGLELADSTLSDKLGECTVDPAKVSGHGGFSSAKNPIPPPGSGGKPVGGWWSQLDSGSKVAIGLSAGQMGAGALEGLFSSMADDERLELEAEIDRRNRQQINRSQAPGGGTPMSFAPRNRGGIINR